MKHQFHVIKQTKSVVKFLEKNGVLVRWCNATLLRKTANFQGLLEPDMGMTQKRIMSRIRIKCFSLESWADLNRKIGKHFKSWVNLNQYLGYPLESWIDSESIPGKSLGSHELNRFKSSRYYWVMSWFESRHLNLSRMPKKVNEV